MKRFFSAAAVGAAFCLCSFTFAASGANAEILDTHAENNEVSATVSLEGGLEADLTVRFEDATGLTAESLGLSAIEVNPLDPTLLSRFQEGLVSIPGGFAVMVTIDPPAEGGLVFDGLVEVELYTKNLHFTAGSPLRLFSAPKGGAFRDITDLNAGGSYRTRGTKGHFSDFIIVADARSLPEVIGAKFSRLNDALIVHSSLLGPALHTTLSNKLAAAESAWQAGQYDAAIDAIEEFDEAISDAADADLLPNEWRAAGGVRNIAGELRADARTLRFSLTLGANNL